MSAFIVCSGLLFAVLAILCFYRLGEGTVVDWDEARHGVSAYEMSRSGEWIVTTYKGSPDYWNLKPPLSEWAICAFFAAFGYSRAVFRAYSACSMFLCAILVFLWSWKRNGKIAALFSLLALLAMAFLWVNHCARSGDPDSLFILLCTISTLCLAEACGTNPRALVLSCFSASLAFLTKSYHAGILVMEMIVVLILLRRRTQIGRSVLILSLAALILPAGIWALLRVQRDGFRFLSEMILTDVLHRSMTVVEEHSGGPTTYLDYLLGDLGCVACITVLPAGLLLSKRLSNNQIVLAVAVLVPLTAYSLVKTKLFWYVYPAFPALALLAGDGVQKIAENGQKWSFKCIALCIPILIALLSCHQRINQIVRFPMETEPAKLAMEACLDRNDETASHVVYLDLSDEEREEWSQSEYLTIQLAGDCRPGDGTVEDWRNDPDALLFTERDRSSSSEGQIIRTYEEYCLISH